MTANSHVSDLTYMLLMLIDFVPFIAERVGYLQGVSEEFSWEENTYFWDNEVGFFGFGAS